MERSDTKKISLSTLKANLLLSLELFHHATAGFSNLIIQWVAS